MVCGRALCSATGHFLYYACSSLSTTLNRRCRQFYSSHIFHAVARLDVPTWEDPAVSAQINALFPRQHYTISWDVILTTVDTVCAILRMFSQTAVLFGVLRGHKDGLLFAGLTFASNLVSYMNYSSYYKLPRSRHILCIFLPMADWSLQLGLLPHAIKVISEWKGSSAWSMILNIAKKSSQVVSRNTSMQVRRLPLNHGTLPTCLAEYRNLVNHVGVIAGDFWTVFYDSHNDNLLHPIRIILIPLCELPLVRSSDTVSLCALCPDIRSL